MYTVEFEPDASVIFSLDESGEQPDVEVIICDDSVVYIRQFDEDLDHYDMVIMSYKQLLQIYAGLKSPEGTFILTGAFPQI